MKMESESFRISSEHVPTLSEPRPLSEEIAAFCHTLLDQHNFSYSVDGIDVTHSEVVGLIFDYIAGTRVLPPNTTIRDYLPNNFETAQEIEQFRQKKLGGESISRQVPAETKTSYEVRDNELIAACRTINEVKVVLEENPLVTNQSTLFNVSELNDGLALAYESGFTNLNGITKSGNLREHVAKLLIAEIKTFFDLRNLLKHINELTGSSGTRYSQEYLLKLVDAVEQGTEDEHLQITNTYGFRDALLRCIHTKIKNK